MTPQQKEQMKARFFGQHLGAKCFYGSQSEDNDTLLGVDLAESIVSTQDGIERVEHSDKNFKLILRPLFDITDEEAIECANMISIWDSEMQVSRYGKYLVVSCENVFPEIRFYFHDSNPMLFTLDGIDDKDAGMVYDWLRSKNFCLPFCGLDPIAEGWAVLELVNQPQF